MSLERFAPDQVREWDQSDMDKLVQRFVVVRVPASDDYKSIFPGAKWEGGAGIVVDAYVNEVDQVYGVLWDYGMGWSWNRETGADVLICDNKDHGRHTHMSPEVLKCIEGVFGQEG